MIESLGGIFLYFVFAAIFIAILSIIFFFATRKYKKSRVEFLAVFTTLNKRKVMLIASLILNLTLVSFFAVATSYFNYFSLYMIIINVIVYMIVALDIHMIFSNLVYTAISIFSLKLINLVYNYLFYIFYDRLTFILGLIFVVLIIVYELFVTFRQLEIILKKKGGKFDNGKSKSKKSN